MVLISCVAEIDHAIPLRPNQQKLKNRVADLLFSCHLKY